jgi:glyoxylase-like metal-dependent hydrolase (beta-lactamase superfamily II)
MRHTRLATKLAACAGLSLLALSAHAQQGGGQGGPGQQAPPALRVTPLSGGAYWTTGGAGANTGFVVGTNGVIVIDAKMTPDSAKEMLADIAKVTPKPVTHVILTHSDPDHVNGLAGFPKGLTIIAQENCKKEMEDAVNALPAPGPQGAAAAALRDYLPTQTVGKTQDMTIDGVRLRLLYFGPAHTSGDLIVYLPQQKILYTGDILTMQFPLPLVHREKHGTAQGMLANLKGIAAMDVTTYVPGHGDLQTKAGVQKRLAGTQTRFDQVKMEFAQGKTLPDVRKAAGDPPPAFPGMQSFTEVVYRDLSAAQPFDAHDLSGVWYIHGGPGFVSLTRALSPQMTQWAQAKYDAARPGLGPRGKPLGNDPTMTCDPMGLVRSLIWGVYPVQIVQTPKQVIMLFDWFYNQRSIWLDGRSLLSDPDPGVNGYSVGHWQGNTLVVESNGFDDKEWLDADGHPNSTDMKLEERYRRLDHDSFELKMTLTDPTAYTKPWVADVRTGELVTPGLDPLTTMREDLCVPSEEEKYRDVVREPAANPNAQSNGTN